MTKKYKFTPYRFLARLLVLALLAVGLVASPALTDVAFAGGKPDGQGNVVASLCVKNRPPQPVQLSILGAQTTRDRCTRDDGYIVEPGGAMPVAACLNQNSESPSIQVYNAGSQGCQEQGYVLLQQGQQFPGFTIKDQGGTADGTSGSDTGAAININRTVATSGKVCGDPGQEAHIDPVIDLGCKGKGNAILDLTFAIMRFLSLGAGLVMIGSTIVAGIQYTVSRGDPQATAAALKRIVSTVSALFFFVFAYAILNWVVPAGVLK